MKLQLIVFSLILAAAFVIQILMPKRQTLRSPHLSSQIREATRAELLLAAAKEALPVYALFAAVALLMIDFGKPERLPQYAGWAIVVLQTLRGIATTLTLERTAHWIALLAYLCLIYLWGFQLPLFDPLPY